LPRGAGRAGCLAVGEGPRPLSGPVPPPKRRPGAAGLPALGALWSDRGIRTSPCPVPRTIRSGGGTNAPPILKRKHEMNRSLPILAALSLAAFGANAYADTTKVDVDDSFNSKTDVTKVDDSFNTKNETTKIDVNKKTDVTKVDTDVDIDDSYNTTNKKYEDNDVTKKTEIDDSYNTTKKTEIDDSYNTSHKTENTVEDSYNRKSEVDDSYNTTKKTEIDDSYNTSNKTENKVEDSYNTTKKSEIDDSYNTDVTTKVDDSFNDHSTNLSNVLNNLSNPVSSNELKATVAHNKVLNLNLGGKLNNVEVRDAFAGARGINSMNTNTGAHSIQQVGVSISVVQTQTK
jgi:hypothetical protein